MTILYEDWLVPQVWKETVSIHPKGSICIEKITCSPALWSDGMLVYWMVPGQDQKSIFNAD